VDVSWLSPAASRPRAGFGPRERCSRRIRVWTWTGIVGAVAIAWVATITAGGSKTALPHAFYIPVIAAAIRFGFRGALVAAMGAGVVAGPLLPLDVAAGTAQAPGNWITRLAFFVVIGQVTAYLAHYSLAAIAVERANRRFCRDVDAAITAGHLRLEYQPVIHVATGEMVGAEALVRWDHPARGPIAPTVFIPHAERSGCVNRVTKFVIAEACRQAGEWRRKGLVADSTFKLAINISGSDLDDENLVVLLRDQLGQHELPGGCLVLEITETDLVANLDRALDSLGELRTLDIDLAIDDFGVGESSLANLHRYPVDVVKIDRLFIARVDNDHGGKNMLRAVIDLSHAMGVRALAEGVETSAQAGLLRELDVDLAQGYLFARPQRPEAIEAALVDPDALRAWNRTCLTGGAPAEAVVPGARPGVNPAEALR
jgi:EAL domain-containing protein (putative c-di-GMP-specific phosphodiesterase class I)